ncbi:MAG: bifunctional oligoribonuclease/PAP phosphatase NrnA [Bacteroidetes bacterium]|nr:bifunctional oligoribonuclease/PAP phosphatase NrnA [Bacteroidota bacterium]
MTQLNPLTSLASIFRSSSTFAIVTHSNPDGDTIGSALALAEVLNAMGNQAKVLIPNTYPGFLAWMPGIGHTIIFEKQAQLAKQIIQQSRYIVSVDHNALSRAGNLADDIRKSAAIRIMIDHHIDPEHDNFDLIYWDTRVSSTAELVYRLLTELELSHMITRSVAENLYVGIMTDTGSFKYSIGNPETFRAAASLISLGIDGERINRLIYDTFSEDRLRLFGFALLERMQVLKQYKTAIISLSLSDLKNFNYQIGDTEGLSNYPLSMQHINLAVLITERKDQIRLSFRSKGSFPANELARLHFDGGGHPNAAGGSSKSTLSETIDKLLSVLPQYAELLSYEYQ